MLSDNITREKNGTLCFASYPVTELAKQYGTPLYLFDEEQIRKGCRMYKSALRKHFGPESIPYYTGKGAAFKEMYRIMAQEGMGVGALSAGELHTALSAGFPADRLLFLGSGKTDADIGYALDHGIGRFAVESPEELSVLNTEARKRGVCQEILLCISPGIAPPDGADAGSGAANITFGVSPEGGQAAEFVRRALISPGVKLMGFHCRPAFPLSGEDGLRRLADVLTGFMTEMRNRYGYTARELALGGCGVLYSEIGPKADVPRCIGRAAALLKHSILAKGLPQPLVSLESGFGIAAGAGMAVYSVIAVKRTPGSRSYLIVDGGMTDDSLFGPSGAQHTVLHGSRAPEKSEIFDLAGRCCEGGYILQRSVSLPADTARGDLICVSTDGSFRCSAEAVRSRAARPPVVMLGKKESRVAVRRETLDDLCALDI